MIKILAQTASLLFASAFAYKIEDVHQLKQTGPRVSGSLMVTIGAKSLLP